MKNRELLLALVCVTLSLESAGPAYGQERFVTRQQGPPNLESIAHYDDYGRVFYPDDPLKLVLFDHVREELEISDDQLSAIVALVSDGRQRIRLFSSEGDRNLDGILGVAITAVQDSMRGQLPSILSTTQYERLKQLSVAALFHNKGLVCLRDDRFRALSLTDAQIKQLEVASARITQDVEDQVSRLRETEIVRIASSTLQRSQLKKLEELSGYRWYRSNVRRKKGSKASPQEEVKDVRFDAFSKPVRAQDHRLPPDPFRLVRLDYFRDLLGLSEPQRVRLDALRDDAKSECLKFVSSELRAGSDPKTIIRTAREMNQKLIADGIQDVLGPAGQQQLNRLVIGVAIRNDGLKAFSSHLLRVPLDVTDEQNEMLTMWSKSLRKKLVANETELMITYQRNVLADVLTKDQAAMFEAQSGIQIAVQENMRRRPLTELAE